MSHISFATANWPKGTVEHFLQMIATLEEKKAILNIWNTTHIMLAARLQMVYLDDLNGRVKTLKDDDLSRLYEEALRKHKSLFFTRK